MNSLTQEKRYDMTDAFNSMSRYLDDLLNINNIHFDQMVHRIHPIKLNLSIHSDTVSTKIYNKRGDFVFDIVNFPFLDSHVPRCPSYGVYYTSQLIRFARAYSHVNDFNNRNKFLTAKLFTQGY